MFIFYFRPFSFKIMDFGRTDAALPGGTNAAALGMLDWDMTDNLSQRFQDANVSTAKRRVVAAVLDNDLVEFGVLQRGFYYRASVPLQLER